MPYSRATETSFKILDAPDLLNLPHSQPLCHMGNMGPNFSAVVIQTHDIFLCSSIVNLSQQPLQILNIPHHIPTCLQPIPSTRQLGVGLNTGSFETYDASTLALVQTWQLGHQPILAGTEGAEGSIFLSATGGAVSHLDVRSPVANTFTVGGEVCAITSDPAHRFLALSDSAQNVHLWDLRKQSEPLLHQRAASTINALTFLSSVLIAGEENGSLTFFTLRNGSASVKTMEAGGSFTSLHSLPMSHLLSIRLFDGDIKLQILKFHGVETDLPVTEAKEIIPDHTKSKIDLSPLSASIYTSVNDNCTQVITGIPAYGEETLTIHTLSEVGAPTKKVNPPSILTPQTIR